MAPGHVVQDQSERDGDDGEEHDLHQRRADARWRRLVGGDDRRAAGGVPGLAGAAVDAGNRAGDRGDGRASELAVHRARVAVPDHRRGLGSPEGRADQRDHLRRPPGHHDAAGLPGVQLDAPACTSGATMGSETTAAAAGSVGKVRRDPMAMLPFCGYHMGDYFRHWIQMQRSLTRDAEDFPRELVPQGRATGSFLWPGFQENMRVLKWIVDRVRGRGARPRDADRLDAALRGHRLDRARRSRRRRSTRCRRVDPAHWRSEVIEHEELFIDLHDHLPPEMVYERELLICRL